MDGLTNSMKPTDILSILFVQMEQVNGNGKTTSNPQISNDFCALLNSEMSKNGQATADGIMPQLEDTVNEGEQAADRTESEHVKEDGEHVHKETETIPMAESFLLGWEKFAQTREATNESSLESKEWTGVVDLSAKIKELPSEVKPIEASIAIKPSKMTDNSIGELDIKDMQTTMKEQKIVKAEAVALPSEQEAKIKETLAPANQKVVQNMVKKEIVQQVGSMVKLVQPEKIIVQLKPIELGLIEVTVEMMDGEVQIKMKSDNKDVQELLDSLSEEINDELKNRLLTDTDEATDEKDKEEKTKEEFLTSKKGYEEEETDLSFEELFTNWLGGHTNGWNNRYRQ